jgi:GH15 family glucan-1,4-alpha-glucosidase
VTGPTPAAGAPAPLRLEELGLIGNGQFAAHVGADGDVVWCCLPRFDAEPLLASLLDPEGGGRFRVAPVSGVRGRQRYFPNTNVLETEFEDDAGAFRVVDFAPRFVEHQRAFHPTQLFRIVEPLRGTPRVTVECRPIVGWSRRPAPAVQGSNHVQFDGFPAQVRLTTDVPLSYLGGQPFTLSARRHLALTWGRPIEEPLGPLASRFLGETVRYWERWVKDCDVPPMYQEQVIRSALALKLHCFEDTGAIVAATTTSIPESPGSGRTWDYRYCWLRDAYYVLAAFRRLGRFEERERFTQWILDVAGGAPDLALAPLYRVDGRSDLAEAELPGWPGYGGSGPVRSGNGAAVHVQHDVYGETVLALAPVFVDERFRDERSPATLALLTALAKKGLAVAGEPDAGIWEFRKAWTPQTFSSLMSWAGADRAAMVLERRSPGSGAELAAGAERLREQIISRCWRGDLRTFGGAWDSDDLDASLLQMVPLRFLPRTDPRLVSTVDAIARDLARGDWVDRYRADDGFGRPEVAFVVCTFWLVQALAVLGRIDEARRRLDATFRALSPLGLIAEDYDPVRGRLWGNFPQAYSHVGLIHAAFDASPRWYEVL